MTEKRFQRMGAVASWLRKRWFLAGLFAAIGLGRGFPGPGDVLRPGASLTPAVTIIRFLTVGLTLPAGSIRQGLSAVRLQVFIQVFIFAVVPAYFAATTRFIFAHIDGPLLVGV